MCGNVLCKAQEQLEAKLTQKRSEVKALNVKLDTAQRKLSQSTADAELANRQTTLTMFQAQQQIAGYDSLFGTLVHCSSALFPLVSEQQQIWCWMRCLQILHQSVPH